MFELSGWLIRSSHALRLVTFSFYSSARVFTQLRTCWWCAQVWRASGRQASRPTVTLLIHPFLFWLFLFSPLDTRRSHLFIFIYIVLFLFIFSLLLHPLKYFGSHFVASDSPPTLFFFWVEPWTVRVMNFHMRSVAQLRHWSSTSRPLISCCVWKLWDMPSPIGECDQLAIHKAPPLIHGSSYKRQTLNQPTPLRGVHMLVASSAMSVFSLLPRRYDMRQRVHLLYVCRGEPAPSAPVLNDVTTKERPTLFFIIIIIFFLHRI